MAASMENVKDKHGFVHDEQLIDPMQTEAVATTDERVTIRYVAGKRVKKALLSCEVQEMAMLGTTTTVVSLKCRTLLLILPLRIRGKVLL